MKKVIIAAAIVLVTGITITATSGKENSVTAKAVTEHQIKPAMKDISSAD